MKSRLGFVGGEKTRVFSPPPWTPQIFVNIWDTTPKIFLGRNMRICWSGRPKILADYTSGQKYKRLKKKGEKWQLCFNPQIIAKNSQKISKKFLVHVLGTLCIKWNKFFEKKQKWQNLTIFGNFHQNLQALENKKGQNDDHCVLTLRLLSEMAKKIQKKFWCMF